MPGAPKILFVQGLFVDFVHHWMETPKVLFQEDIFMDLDLAFLWFGHVKPGSV